MSQFPDIHITKPNKYRAKKTTWILDLLGLKGLYSSTILDTFDPIKRQTTRKVEILENLTIKLKIRNKEVEIKLEKGQ